MVRVGAQRLKADRGAAAVTSLGRGLSGARSARAESAAALRSACASRQRALRGGREARGGGRRGGAFCKVRRSQPLREFEPDSVGSQLFISSVAPLEKYVSFYDKSSKVIPPQADPYMLANRMLPLLMCRNC